MKDEKKERLSYEEAMHGVQTGIAVQLEHGSQCATPKHLRVGVDSAMVQHAAIVRLLIGKGIITEAEYAETLTDEANRELERVEQQVNDMLGADGKIKLR